jgi:hypothetical protein
MSIDPHLTLNQLIECSVVAKPAEHCIDEGQETVAAGKTVIRPSEPALDVGDHDSGSAK